MWIGVVLLVTINLPHVSCYAKPRPNKLPANTFAFRMRPTLEPNVVRMCGYIKLSKDLNITIADTRPWLKEEPSISLNMIFKPSDHRYKFFSATNFEGMKSKHEIKRSDTDGRRVFEKYTEDGKEAFFCVVLKTILNGPETTDRSSAIGYYIFYSDNTYDFIPYLRKDYMMPFLHIEGPSKLAVTQKNENGQDESLDSAFPDPSILPPNNTFYLYVFPTTYVRICGYVRQGHDLNITVSDQPYYPHENATISLHLHLETKRDKYRTVVAEKFIHMASKKIYQGPTEGSVFAAKVNGERKFCVRMKTFTEEQHNPGGADRDGFYIYYRDNTYDFIPYQGGNLRQQFYIYITGAQLVYGSTADDKDFHDNDKPLKRVKLSR